MKVACACLGFALLGLGLGLGIYEAVKHRAVDQDSRYYTPPQLKDGKIEPGYLRSNP